MIPGSASATETFGGNLDASQADGTTHVMTFSVNDSLGTAHTVPLTFTNDFGTTRYRGPCPPAGHGPHRYFFRLYALEAPLELEAGASVQEVQGALEDRGALAVAELVGTYER